MGHPKGSGMSDEFVIRVFKTSLINELLHDGVEVLRGSRVVIVPATEGGVKCYASREVLVGLAKTQQVLASGGTSSITSIARHAARTDAPSSSAGYAVNDPGT